MNEKVIEYQKLKWKTRKELFKLRCKEFAREAWEHKEELAAVAGAVFAGGKLLNSLTKETREKRDRELRLWDPRLGRYSYMKRRPKQKEWDEIDRRYHDGESYREILKDLNLIK